VCLGCCFSRERITLVENARRRLQCQLVVEVLMCSKTWENMLDVSRAEFQLTLPASYNLHTELLRPIMYFDLNVPIPTTAQTPSQPLSKKAKGKQPQVVTPTTYTAAQIAAIENRVDLLVHCMYTFLLVVRRIHRSQPFAKGSRIYSDCVQSDRTEEDRPKKPCQ
jgi:hypothetical protein